MQIKFLSISILLFSLNANALETDNYLMWNRELKDSSEKINKFLVSEIQNALNATNKKKIFQDCETVTNNIAAKFMSYFIDKNPLENYLKASLKHDEIYPGNGDYITNSIYRDPYRFYVPAFGLSPNVQVKDIYFGTDKLTHFSSTGRRYFNHYLKQIKDGMSDLDAQRSAVLFGIKNETSILGYWSSGVYSYGDVEANYQGFLFYKKMCFDKTETFLTQNEAGKWKLASLPDINEYVSPYWDETFNLSYRLPVNWDKVAPVIKERYCPMINDAAVVERMDYYHHYPHNSFSLELVRELQGTGFEGTPIPETTQSITKLCGI
ncbi:MAG TPA: hypothetical protein VNJ08_12960 [Bacteriovoracaceae bacterium]|nr:hypothetical protein [Bacteriovoracaceae bacterium]